MRTITAVLIAGLISASSIGIGYAQQASQEQIIKALKPKAKTRSIITTPTLSADEQAIIDATRQKTRGITAVEREKLDEIVESKNLPSIDLEILFDYNSADISAAAKPDLIELGLALRSDVLQDAVFLVAGHTDAAGTNDYNQRLSDQRANSVKQFLVSTFSIPTERLIAVGYGEEKLKNSSEPESGLNRRVNIVNLSN